MNSLVHVMVAQDVTDVLAKETLDAFAELLGTVGIGLTHAPCAVGSVGRARFELAGWFS